MTSPITRDDLVRMFPRALPAWLDTLLELGPVLAQHYGWNRLDWVHFCGQISAETNGLSLANMRENMNFKTAARIKQVYAYRINLAISEVTKGRKSEPAWIKGLTLDQAAARLVNKPTELANIVYGGREGTPWMEGARYIGRGPSQITHKNNYEAIGEEISRQPGGGVFNLVEQPELLESDAELGIRSAFADWEIKGLSRWAQKDDCDTLSDALNTGNIKDNVKPHGLPARRMFTAQAKKVWPRNFTFEGVQDVPAAPVVVAQEVAAIPNLATVSRKALLLNRLIMSVRAFIASVTVTSVLEYLGFAKEIWNELQIFVADHAVALCLLVGVLLLLALGALVRWLQEDVEQGRYIPSKVARAPSATAGDAVEPDGKISSP